MNLFQQLSLISIFIISQPLGALAQGCSDAGFCTMESFKPHENDSMASSKNHLRTGVSYGSADHAIFVVGSYIAYEIEFNETLRMEAKLTTLLQNGNDISVFGMSDVFVNATYKISRTTQATLGLKIPLNNGNRTLENTSLPMDYQSSLGTFDLLLGLSQNIKKWQFTVAWQQPLTQNENGFLADDYPQKSALRNIQSTNDFERSSDVLLRISYPFKLSKKINLTPSLLSIYHLANDQYTDGEGVMQIIDGSQGLTLNGNIYVDYNLTNKSSFQLSLAAPFVVRDARPDGLTRRFVVNLEYHHRF